jgi:hypothetical protein
MANWVYNVRTWTPVAVADATNFTNGGYMALQGGSSTQRVIVHEVFGGGQAGSSSPGILQLARDSTIGVTLVQTGSGVAAASLDPATAALGAPVVGFNSATTLPQRSSTLSLHNESFNAYGGLLRMNFPVGQEPILLGNAASFGELSLSAFTGGTPGLMGAHFVFEPL